MNKWLLIPLLALLSTACEQAPTASCAALEVSNAWIREMPPGPQLTAGYMQINNPSEQDVVVQRFSSPRFARVELHESQLKDGQMQMRKLENLTIPATEGLDLQPGGWHLMLFEPSAALTAGQTLQVTLDCGNDKLTTTAEVRKGGPSQHDNHHGHH